MRRSVLAGALSALLIGSGLTTAAPPVAGSPIAAANRWTTSAVGPAQPAARIACPTTSVCLASHGGRVVSTTDGGTTWTDVALPPSVSGVADLACPASTRCWLLTFDVDGHRSVLTGPPNGPFTTTAPLLPAAPVARLACLGPTHCLVTDGVAVWATRNLGSTWSRRLLSPRLAELGAFTCLATAGRCWVAGRHDAGGSRRVLSTDDDGRTWNGGTVPDATWSVSALACPTAQTCYLAGAHGFNASSVYRSVDGGVTWAQVPWLSRWREVHAIQCTTTDSCVIIGVNFQLETRAAALQPDGSWVQQRGVADTRVGPGSLSCPDIAQCRAVYPSGAFTGDATGWTWRPLPSALSDIGHIACASPQRCLVVGSDATSTLSVQRTTDSGRTWTVPSAFPTPTSGSTYTVAELTCPPGGNRCYARWWAYGDQRAAITVSTDGGATWTDGRIAGRPLTYATMACGGSTTCMLSGDQRTERALRATSNGGRLWTDVSVPAGVAQSSTRNLLGCTGPTSCVVVSRTAQGVVQAFTTDDLGATWSPDPHAVPTSATPYVMDCGGPSCLLIMNDGSVVRTADGGTTWTTGSPPPVTTNGEIRELACTAGPACVVVEYDPDAGVTAVLRTTDAGTTWNAVATPPDPEQHPQEVSCVNGPRCFAIWSVASGAPAVASGPV